MLRVGTACGGGKDPARGMRGREGEADAGIGTRNGGVVRSFVRARRVHAACPQPSRVCLSERSGPSLERTNEAYRPRSPSEACEAGDPDTRPKQAGDSVR